MTDHEFRAIVYDINARILFANLYVYGYKKEKLPDGYSSMLPPPPALPPTASIPFDADEEIRLKGEPAVQHEAVDNSAGRTDVRMSHGMRVPALLLLVAMCLGVFLA